MEKLMSMLGKGYGRLQKEPRAQGKRPTNELGEESDNEAAEAHLGGALTPIGFQPTHTLSWARPGG